jgi:hypothetical protein
VAAVAVALLVLLAVEGWAPRLLDRSVRGEVPAAGDAHARAVASEAARERVSPVPDPPDGRSLDLLGFPVSAVQNRGARFNPSVTPGPNGRWDVVYAEGGLPNGGPAGPTTVFWRGVTK